MINISKHIYQAERYSGERGKERKKLILKSVIMLISNETIEI